MTKKIMFLFAIILVFIFYMTSFAGEARRVDNPHQIEDGTYIYGGSIFTIKRLDNNDDWIEVKTPFGVGRYKYRVDCNNCGECWHNPYGKNGEECYLISESWNEKQNDLNR